MKTPTLSQPTEELPQSVDTAARWQSRLNAFKQLHQLSDLAIANRLNTTQSIINRVRHGNLSMPWPIRVRLADLGNLRSVRRLVLELLPEQTAAILLTKHVSYIGADLAKTLRPLPENDLSELGTGNEHPVWITLLNDLKAQLGTDKKVAEALATTQSILSVVRAGAARLPFDVKIAVIRRTSYSINDAILLSLLPRQTIAAIQHAAGQRPDPASDGGPYAWEKPPTAIPLPAEGLTS